MKSKNVKNLQRLVEDYWRMCLAEDPHREPPSYLVEMIDYLERKHKILFNTESSQWHQV